jgi:hypothetical protein
MPWAEKPTPMDVGGCGFNAEATEVWPINAEKTAGP